jgi:tRNA pseudouridine38-40 synthase
MATIRLHLEYEGTHFSGWAAQRIPDTIRTVQAEVESALQQMTGERITVRYASRTDAGVHARDQVVAFESGAKDIPLIGYLRGLTTLTPHSIVVRSAALVEDGWCPRRNSRGKIYRYTYWNDPQPSAIDRRFSWWERLPMNVDAMHEAAQHLLGLHDFESFRATGCNASHAVRRMYELSVVRGDRSSIHLSVIGNAFVKHMVRIIAGTIRDVGIGKIDASEMPRILAAKARSRAGMTAPAGGLCLEEIIYDERLPERPKPGAKRVQGDK